VKAESGEAEDQRRERQKNEATRLLSTFGRFTGGKLLR